MQSEDDGRVSYNAMYALQQLNENIVEENRCKIRRSIALLEKTREEYPDFSYTNTRSNFVLVALEDRYKKGLYKEFEFIFGDQYSLPSHCRINISEPANIELFLARYKTLREENAKI
jgi:histidinol-phosphate/aromatic aminotransferase/cobyric acid decarboxylase-like protein